MHKLALVNRKAITIAIMLPLLMSATLTNVNTGGAVRIIDFDELPENLPPITTSIKDLSFADATSGIVLIEPPVANQFGSAELTFPLRIPAGRQGMTPDVSASYSSEGGNGWLGLGWSMSPQEISIETRWGVPRYDADKETETYLLNGAQLGSLAHRGNQVDRENEKEFVRRIEGSFDNIVRHGTHPSNYWWEVTTKDGMISIYGGTTGGQPDPLSRLEDNNGNVAQWLLTNQIDRNGNTIKYYYSIVSDAGIEGGAVEGRNIYLERIEYTGHQNEAGAFSIHFIRRPASEGRRPDIEIDCKLGFKKVMSELLQTVEVRYRGDIVRTFNFNYEEGAFQRSLLASIAEIDSDGVEFYKHDFKYFDDIRDGNGKYQPYSNATDWVVPDDNIVGSIVNTIDAVNGETSMLGGAESSGFSAGGALTFGFDDLQWYSKTNTAGGRYDYAQSTGEGLISLVDINGDGLPDKLYRKNGSLYYRKNLFAEGSASFGDELGIAGTSHYNTFKSTAHSVGAEAIVGLGPASTFAGYIHTSSTNTIKSYLTDFNGDGLVDIGHNSSVYFNSSTGDGSVTFDKNSDLSPSPVFPAGDINSELIEVDPEELEDMIDAFPLHDVVRFWEAPMDGTVEILAPVQLVNNLSSEAQEYGKQDGVRVTIQHSDTELWNTRMEWGDFDEKIPVGLGSVAMLQGERIYFRVQSVFDGLYDEVIWNPVIRYNGMSDSIVDANRKPLYAYNAGDDFMLASNQVAILNVDGEVKIEGVLNKPVTSDDIEIEIARTDTFQIKTVIHTEFIAWDMSGVFPIEIDDVPVAYGDAVEFTIKSKTNVDWPALTWTPRLYYTDSYVDSIEVTAMDGTPLLDYCPAVNMSMYNGAARQVQPWVAGMTGTATLMPIDDPNIAGNGEVTLSVKADHELIYRENYPLSGGLSTAQYTFAVEEGDTLFIEFHTIDNDVDSSVVDQLAQLDAVVEIAGLLDTIPVGVFSLRTVGDEIFGPMYRNWGHFIYNGNRNRMLMVINESELMPPDRSDLADEVEDIEDVDDLENAPISDVSEDLFFIMFSDPKSQSWMGLDALTYLKGDTIGSSRLGEDDLLPDVFTAEGGALAAPFIEFDVTSNSVSAGLSVLSYGQTWATTTNVLDVIDFNGDLYPDIVSGGKIQYTNTLGGLETDIIDHGLEPQITKSIAKGGTVGGEFPISDGANSGGTSGSGSNNKKSRSKSKANKSGSKSKNAASASSVSGFLTASITFDEDEAEEAWMDINGDGLVDKLYDNGTVRLNIGYAFLPAEQWGYDTIRAGLSRDIGFGGGLNFVSGSIQAGLSQSVTEQELTNGLFDVNSDGLVDIITSTEPIRVRFNKGNGFTREYEWGDISTTDKGSATGESANTAFTVCLGITILGIKACFNPSGSIMRGVSRQHQSFHDIDGDGFADVLSSDHDADLSVRTSNIKKTNLLQSIERPLGGSIALDYAKTGSTFDLPYCKWTLATVTLDDGLAGDGADISQYEIQYSEGQHNRHEREFYGFARVSVTDIDTENGNAPYRTTEYRYDTRSFYHKGLLLSKRIFDSGDNVFAEINYNYELLDAKTGTPLPGTFISSDSGEAFPALTTVQEYHFEGDISSAVQSSMSYQYDEFGNITVYTHNGNGTLQDALTITKSYFSSPDQYLVSLENEITISDGMDRVIRHSEMQYDPKGNLLESIVQLNDGVFSHTDFDYDQYGNINVLTKPENHLGERLDIRSEYDDDVHTYVVREIDGYGYEKSYTYHHANGQLLERIDENGQPWRFKYDIRGRLISEATPYEIVDDIEFLKAYTYYPDADVPYGICSNWDPEYDEMITVAAFYDGAERLVQTKTPVSIHTGGSNEEINVSVSGKQFIDAFGRVVKTHHPSLENSIANLEQYSPSADPVNPEEVVYDIMDRETKITERNGGIISYAYDIVNSSQGVASRQSAKTDQKGRIEKILIDTRNRTVEHILDSGDEEIITSLTHNAGSELLAIYDNNGNAHEFIYDLAGRRIGENHPDGGYTEYIFDPAGNIIQKITPNIRSEIPNGGAINYTYEKERLIKIEYPKNYQNLVMLHYGEPEAEYQRAGKLWLVEDASGGEEYYYGLTEEIVKSIRTILLNPGETHTFITELSYDNWDRIKTITYPDGELLTYSYNKTGQLQKMSSEKDDVIYSILDYQGYDKFQDVVVRQFGNGIRRSAEYDDQQRYLVRNHLTGTNGQSISDISYTYNPTHQLTDIAASSASTDTFFGPAQYTFAYDDMHRLTSATGKWTGDSEESFNTEYAYDVLHNITSHIAERTSNGEANIDESFAGEYSYSAERPHAPDAVRGIDYHHDDNGNVKITTGSATYNYQQFLWDEDDRLMSVSTDGYFTRFTYDAFGNRVIKSQGGYQGIFVDGAPAGLIGHSDDFKVYVNGLLTFTRDGFEKHYYSETNRLFTKQGVGKFNNNFQTNQPITAGDIDYSNRIRLIRQAAKEFFITYGAPPGPPTIPWYYAQPNQTGDPIVIDPSGASSITPPGWPIANGAPDPNGPPGPPVWFAKPVPRDSINAGFNFTPFPGVQEVTQYFYHRDVRGSTNYITNTHGELSYQAEYLPTGRLFIERADKIQPRPNLFQDHDIDRETGLYNISGNYYNPTSGLYESPDRIEEVAGVSPYTILTQTLLIDPEMQIENLIGNQEFTIRHLDIVGVAGSVSSTPAANFLDFQSAGTLGSTNLVTNDIVKIFRKTNQKFSRSRSKARNRSDALSGPNDKRNPQRDRSNALKGSDDKRNPQRKRSNALTGPKDPRAQQIARQDVSSSPSSSESSGHSPFANTNPAISLAFPDVLNVQTASGSVPVPVANITSTVTHIPLVLDVKKSQGARTTTRRGVKRKTTPPRKFQHKPGRVRG